MEYLFDTHVFIWYAVGDNRLSPAARDLVESFHIRYISIASIWEMAIKINIGRLKFDYPFEETINEQFGANEYQLLNLDVQHLFKLSTLELHHRDPFDRVILSQAMVERIPIVSADAKFDEYDVERIW